MGQTNWNWYSLKHWQSSRFSSINSILRCFRSVLHAHIKLRKNSAVRGRPKGNFIQQSFATGDRGTAPVTQLPPCWRSHLTASSACWWRWTNASPPCWAGPPRTAACPHRRAPRRVACAGWIAARTGATSSRPSVWTSPWRPRAIRPRSRRAGSPGPGTAGGPWTPARRAWARACRWERGGVLRTR